MKSQSEVKIFYADDDADDRYLFKSAVSEIDTSVALTCFSGGDMLEKALLENRYECDLVFLDVNMPGRSGLQTLESLQQAIEFNNLKVVIFTTSADLELVQKTYNQNAVLFVQKPMDFDVLVSTLEKIVNNKNLLQRPVPFKDFQFNFQ